MDVIYLSSWLSRKAGGIFEIALALAKNIHSSDVSVSARGLDDEYWSSDSQRWLPLNASVCRILGPRFFGYAPSLARELRKTNADLLHLHYMWMYPSVATFRWAAASRRPYVVTPNGMLEPWALRNSALKKRLAAAVYERRMLAHAACLHANTAKELADIRAFGLKNPVAVIPNGVDLPSNTSSQNTTDPKILLYIGRLHPKKGLPHLLQAWAACPRDEPHNHGWRLVIGGWDQCGQSKVLKELCASLSLDWSEMPISDFLAARSSARASLTFVGPVFGEDKNQLLRSASAFVLPSLSEGLPIAVLEAWSFGLPVLMTEECNLPEGFAAEAAIQMRPEVDSIAAALRTLLDASADHLEIMGRCGRSLVEERFSWRTIAGQMRHVYEWCLGRAPRPDCVVLT